MITFLVSLLLLAVGYAVYGRFVEKIFPPDGRKTPAMAMRDDVDYIPLSTWKATLIQLLNIAGTGPIFGALLGACFGPIVFLWIVFGSILGGAVHDYMSGMISERHGGTSIATLSGHYLGKTGLYAMRIFSIILLLFTGVVFIVTPASLLAKLTPGFSMNFWMIEIMGYYILATLLPIDKIIGWFYPIFAAVLAIMAVLVMGAILFASDYHIPEMQLANLHPKELSAWPFMFITVACGAISGFHSTQAPLMAKCMVGERAGRKIFYGAMILEAVIALMWAAAGSAFYGSTQALSAALAAGGPASAVFDISTNMLGAFGGVLAIIGVVVCPITSGDTSFRVVRMIVTEWMGLEQKTFFYRLMITLPLLAVAAMLTQIDFSVLWRYFSWSNQTLATVALWVATAYLLRYERWRFSSLVTALPATFMTAVCTSYIFMAPEGFKLPAAVGYPVGIGAALALFAFYGYTTLRRDARELPLPSRFVGTRQGRSARTRTRGESRLGESRLGESRLGHSRQDEARSSRRSGSSTYASTRNGHTRSGSVRSTQEPISPSQLAALQAAGATPSQLARLSVMGVLGSAGESQLGELRAQAARRREEARVRRSQLAALTARRPAAHSGRTSTTGPVSLLPEDLPTGVPSTLTVPPQPPRPAAARSRPRAPQAGPSRLD